MRRKRVTEQTRTLYRSARYASVGIEIGVSIVLGMGIGWWIDVEFDVGPWGLFIGMAFGMAAAVRAFMRTYRMIMADHAAEETATTGKTDDGSAE